MGPKAHKLIVQYPVTVRLRFKSELHRDVFMGQLSDGWGENHCSLQWEGPFREAEFVAVDPDDDDLEHEQECRLATERRLRADKDGG